ncbi:MAG: selenide, water dikinase SelD, partial [Candidatus Cloacimonadota bacterium]|nr:selenide, water dikinase SelD [Candidatus Cloacimonadota bacterium]
MHQAKFDNVISDFQNADDCGVYQISNDLLLVQTVDFFPPIVDDPFDFGEIAVANALSDVYAMGATPITAMSIVAFPEKKFKLDVLKKILKGGLKKLDEAKVALIGGHSVDDEELKYGLAVTGTVHPDKLFSNNTPREGDLLILTKPLGSGIVNTAVKAEFASENSVKVALSNMKQLNKYAFEIAKSYDLSAITDVTGFGFLGHLSEMIPCDKSIGFEIDFSKIKLLPNLKEYVNLGMVPSGTYDNRDFRAKEIFEMNKIPAEITDILFDPQTS